MFNKTGKSLGIKQNTIPTKNGSFVKTTFAVSNPKLNGYDGELEITEFQLTKKQQESGLANKLSTTQGKTVSLSCYNKIGVSQQGRAYETWYISGDGSTVEILK